MKKTLFYTAILAVTLMFQPIQPSAQTTDIDDFTRFIMALSGLLYYDDSEEETDELIYESPDGVGYDDYIEAVVDSSGDIASKIYAKPIFKYDDDKNISILRFSLLGGNKETENSLLKTLREKSTTYEDDFKGYSMDGVAVISFPEMVQYSVPFHFVHQKIKDLSYAGYILLGTSFPIESTHIGEITNNTWNRWSKLKYCNSLLAEKDIDYIVLTDNNNNYLGYMQFKQSTTDKLRAIFKYIGDKVGSHEFYKYNWK